MLSGRRAFKGESLSDVLAAVLKFEPDWNAIHTLPPHIQNLIRRCLNKDRKQRLQWIGEARIALENPPEFVAAVKGSRLPWSLAAVMTVALIGMLISRFRTAEQPQVVRSFILPPPGTVVSLDATPGTPAISPDGTKIAFVLDKQGSRMIWIRELDSRDSRPLPGTERAMLPFWSPDSKWIGFFADGQLNKIEASGGLVSHLAPSFGGKGGTWNRQGDIVFAPEPYGGLYRISANGGQRVPVTTVQQDQGENSHRYPQFLPDGRHFLFFARRGNADGSGFDGTIQAGSLQDRLIRKVMPANSYGLFA